MAMIGMELVLRPIYPDEVAASDAHELLGVAKGADRTIIRKAYHRLIRKYHPDVCKKAGALYLYEKIVEAYVKVSAEDYESEQRLRRRFNDGDW